MGEPTTRAGACPALARALTLALLLGAGGAHAQVIGETPPPFPDPKKFARGAFASGEAGALVFVGEAGKYAAPGPTFGVRLGYDLFRWLAVQLHAAGATLDATTPAPTTGQSFQTYVYAGEARLSLAIRRLTLFADGGAGLAQLSSNVLDQSGVTGGNRFSLVALGGGGLDYHTLSRHYSVGLEVDDLWMISFSRAQAISIAAYLRYTR